MVNRKGGTYEKNDLRNDLLHELSHELLYIRIRPTNPVLLQ